MVVLGSNGMLGQMVCSYFEKRVRDLVPFNGRFTASDFGDTVRSLSSLEPDIVINCVGLIKQLTQDIAGLHYVNSVVPLELKALLPEETVLVHPSTDCVFNGDIDSPYRIDDPPNAQDAYGWSKYLGEMALIDRPRTLVPRVSIIGPDKRPDGPGLLNWLLRQADNTEIKGFINHWWNGITTLEWCKQVENELSNGAAVEQNHAVLLHWGTKDPINKHSLLKLVARIYHKKICIRKFNNPVSIYRVLEPIKASKQILDQLQDLHDFEE
jgi:dTDP-4-dehydrorhamnose reductase